MTTRKGSRRCAESRFDAGEFDVATIFYAKFQSVDHPDPDAHSRSSRPSFEDDEDDAAPCMTTSPSEEEILADLLPRNLVWPRRSSADLLENGASEQGARMSAMDNATRNAGDMIDKLTIEYNRSRQAVITNELIEIISGAEAL